MRTFQARQLVVTSSLMPNRGRCKLVYLCAELHVTNGRSDRQFSIVIRIGSAPNAESERLDS